VYNVVIILSYSIVNVSLANLQFYQSLLCNDNGAVLSFFGSLPLSGVNMLAYWFFYCDFM